jgi:hypothetical protein
MFVTSFHFRFFGSPQDAKLKNIFLFAVFLFHSHYSFRREKFKNILRSVVELLLLFKVPVPTFEKIRFRLLTSYVSSGSKPNNKKQIFHQNFWKKILPFYIFLQGKNV